MKPITANIGKPNKFDYQKDSQLHERVEYKLVFNKDNAIFRKYWSTEQMQEVASTLSSNFAYEAKWNREGSAPALYAMLSARGVNYDDLFEGKIDPQMMNTLYTQIHELGMAEKEASREDLTPEEKEKAKENLTQKRDGIYEDVYNGLHEITEQFDKSCDMNLLKEPDHPMSPLSEKNRFYADIIAHSSTNYLQDKKCVEGLKKVSEKSNREFNGQPYDVERAYDEVYDKCLLIGKIQSYNASFQKMDEPAKPGVDCSVPLQSLFEFQVMLNTQFDKGEDRYDFANRFDLSNDADFSDFFDSIGGDFTWNLFTRNAIKEGKLFSNITPASSPEEIQAQFSIDSLKKEKEKYVKTKMGKDMIDVVNQCIDKDLNENTYSEEELDKGIEDPALKAKVDSPSIPTNSQEAIKKSYGVFLKQLKDTSKVNSKGELVGNSPVFMDMYNKINAVSKMEKGSKDFDKAYEESQKAINAYIKKRDGFIKIHGYGRERLNITKQMKTMNDAIAPRLKEATKLISDVNLEVKSILYHNEKTNVTEMTGGPKKEQLTKAVDHSLDMNKSKEEPQK